VASDEETRLHGLYVVTDSGLIAPGRLVDAVAAAIRGGARVVQYRDKSDDARRRRAEAGALAALCRERNVLFIVNDDVELAAAVRAGGVHLGRDDPAVAPARAALGERAVIGVSCYNDLERARRLAGEGADYLAFGRFFPSPTKPAAVQAPPDLLGRARAAGLGPLVAIGGITPANAPGLIAAGADMVAVIHGVFGQPDIEAAARAFSTLFHTARRT
jgi:thiamine-phosphate pyrophosphorylase